MADKKTPEELAAEVKAGFETAIDKVKEVAEEALGKAAKGEKLTETTKETADEALLKMNELKGQFEEFEQKMARIGSNPAERAKSIGEQFIDDEQVKSWIADGPTKGKADMKIKATITTATTDAAGSVGGAIAPQRVPGIQELPQRRMTVRDLLSPGDMSSPSLEYVQETGFSNNAAPVAEGAAKPSSDIQLDLKSTSAKVIAHWFKASKQSLDDVPQLRSLIDNRLLYGLAYKEELQLLSGDGTGQNLLGLIPQATGYAEPFTPDSGTNIDTLRLAMLQAVLAEYPATGHVLNPIDWARIELTKDGQGKYIIGQPQGSITPTLWNLPVVQTQAISEDKFLTGAFKMAAQVFDLWQARVEVGFENDDFTKNLITILGEERLALAVYRPEAFIYGDFGNVADA
ncbi:phage major capsid protein, HK97 family [Cohaesibacter marisflavi]|uniref:Phage major capsid protein, HK97 family n=1 Tax=Cohaesibacter marisflavi TaxID=655353 RepID=A0A1I5ADB6_9HYPH|nr:phage major capsid protein [Cohaesibacter marisflavi]SFN60495.1 phage major capsid protein, HK97 family [Cohaesibacter marisflavi]